MSGGPTRATGPAPHHNRVARGPTPATHRVQNLNCEHQLECTIGDDLFLFSILKTPNGPVQEVHSRRRIENSGDRKLA